MALRDVTVRAHPATEIADPAHKALHDPLTGLPNRSLLLDRLRQALARSERTRGNLTMLFVDLANFKVVSDRLGHDAGDEVLQTVAERVRAGVRPTDTLCRLGGDEFVLVCEGVDGPAEAETIASRVEAAVTQPCQVGGHEVALTANVGVLVAEVGQASPEQLLSGADAARRGEAGRRVHEQGGAQSALAAKASKRT